MAFGGFPRNVRATPVPDPVFNSLLEEIEDPAELKVTLRLIWLLGQKRGQVRFVPEAELLNDATLIRGLQILGGDPRERIRQGLNLALSRGTLLRHDQPDAASNRFYLLNTEDNRRRLESRQPLVETPGRGPAHPVYEPEVDAGRKSGGEPSIYDLYENNIGTFGPMLAEQLAEAEESYPSRWIEEAFRLAIHENKRSWSYISAILRRWAAEGKIELKTAFDTQPEDHPGVGVKGGATLWEADGRKHGEPGRHTEADNRTQRPRSRQRR